MYPSEYAYHDNSVSRAESASANCTRYSSGLVQGTNKQEYIHCNGMQLKLTNSDSGQEIYQPSDYYVWHTGSDGKQMFIFPMTVSLTTITLHYYRDNLQGLPRLILYSVPDDFNVWDAPTTGHPHVEVASVPPGGEPAGHRNVSINMNFNTKKVLMYKFRSSFMFAVSEMEFFTCKHTPVLYVVKNQYFAIDLYYKYWLKNQILKACCYGREKNSPNQICDFLICC